MFVRGVAGLFHNFQRLINGTPHKMYARTRAHMFGWTYSAPKRTPWGARLRVREEGSGHLAELFWTRGRESGSSAESTSASRTLFPVPRLLPLLLLTCLSQWDEELIPLGFRKLFGEFGSCSREFGWVVLLRAARYMPWSLFPERERTVPEVNEKHKDNITNVGYKSHVFN